ncbi:MAG: EamA family transporter [Lachnospiraceae bacterium]|nr:EamA family transporter [Lachnospiraceae bacterium]
MSKTKKKELLACLGLIFVTVCWGLGFVFVKTSVDDMPPLYLLGFRFLTAGVILGVIFWKKLAGSGKDQIVHGLIIGVFLFVAMLFQTYGCKYTTAGKNAFLTTIYVILVPFLDRLFNKSRQRLRYFIAAVIGFWGIGLISLTESLSIQLGDWLTLVCGFFYALQIILIARFAKDDDPIVLAAVQFIETGILGFAVAPFVSGPLLPEMFSRGSVYGLAFLVIFPTIFGFGLQNVCQKYAPPAPAAIIMGMEAVVGAVASYFWLGETMTHKMITGCVMLILAMLMVEIDIISYFYPDEYIENAYVIDYRKLYEEGKRAIIFDIDNTLVMHDYPPDERSTALLKTISDTGFKILFLSNNKEKRVKSFRDGSVPEAFYLHKAGKPGTKGYAKAMEIMQSNADTTLFIGDQLFTDIWGAKRAGIYNILVRPIDPHEEIQIVLKRILEKVVISSYLRTDQSNIRPHEKKELNY